MRKFRERKIYEAVLWRGDNAAELGELLGPGVRVLTSPAFPKEAVLYSNNPNNVRPLAVFPGDVIIKNGEDGFALIWEQRQAGGGSFFTWYEEVDA